MKQFLLAISAGLLAVTAVAGPVSAAGRDFGAVYANDQIYRVFGNQANVPDGTGTDPFAIFTDGSQIGVAEFAPGSPTGHHGGRWAVYHASWTTPSPLATITSWSELQAYVSSGDVTLVRAPEADFRCPVLGDPQPLS